MVVTCELRWWAEILRLIDVVICKDGKGNWLSVSQRYKLSYANFLRIRVTNTCSQYKFNLRNN